MPQTPSLPAPGRIASALVAASFAAATLAAAPGPMETLDRGVVALRKSEGPVFVSWRLLSSDAEGTAFNVYRSVGNAEPVRINRTPLAGPTCIEDAEAPAGARYIVRPVRRGSESRRGAGVSNAVGAEPRAWLEIPLKKPADGVSPNGSTYSYSAGDGSVGDLDGDGQLEIVFKWEPSNGKDNSQAGITGNVLLDAYKLDGTHLWRIDLGKNIRAGAHYTQLIVADLDGDGRAEVACRTADGTKDGRGRVIGDANADHRNEGGYILKGPEYLTAFDGRTGAAIDTVTYLPRRHPDTDAPTGDQMKATWGDGYGNRLDRFLAAAASFDGRSRSLVMCRGYYTRTVIAAWDLKRGKLTRRWVFDSSEGPESNRAYAGQGNHNLSVADVDSDGRDEIVYGAMTIEDTGRGMYTTRLHHGDALHVSDLDPARPGLEVFSPHEAPKANGGIGTSFRDAWTGKVIWSTPATGDVGRGVAMDLDPAHPGAECWAANSAKLYNARGEVISEKRPSSMNFGVWWDGDAQRELLDRNFINKWNPADSSEKRLLTAEGCSQNNGTKANPVISGDLIGDWREEVVWRTTDSSALRIYSTTIPTPHRLPTLLENHHYRMSLVWQNVAYNQPPHTDFDMQTRLTETR